MSSVDRLVTGMTVWINGERNEVTGTHFDFPNRAQIMTTTMVVTVMKIEAAKPTYENPGRHRNDRAYLKRKKGRS